MQRHRWYVGLIDKAGQDVDPEKYHAVLSGFLLGYTTFRTEGVWKGTREPSLVFEFIDDCLLPTSVPWIASELKGAGNQESVLYVVDTCDVTFC